MHNRDQGEKAMPIPTNSSAAQSGLGCKAKELGILVFEKTLWVVPDVTGSAAVGHAMC